MSFSIDPTLPASGENIGGGLGASRIRNVASWLLQMFDFSGSIAETITPPFSMDNNGNVRVLQTLVVPTPTTSGQAANKGYVDGASSSFSGRATASGNDYTVTLAAVGGQAPATQAALTNLVLLVRFPSANTGAVTLNANTFGAQAVQKNGAALVSGDITDSDWTLLTWDGSNYQILNIIATNLQATPVSNTAPSSTGIGSRLRYNGSIWVPAIVGAGNGGASPYTTFANTTVSGSAGTAIFAATFTAPITLSGGSWLPAATFLVNFQSHTSGASALTGVLSSNVSGAFLPVYQGATGVSASSAHPVSIGATCVGQATVAAGSKITITLTGYNSGAQADLQQFP